MKESNLHNILEELREIAPMLAQWHQNAASQLGPLPKQYFEQFPACLQRRREVHEELAALAPLLSELKLGSPSRGAVQEGYFETLHARLLAWQELYEVAPLLAGKNTTKASLGELPKGYFTKFEERLQARLEQEEKSEFRLLDQIKASPEEQIGELPSNYFANLEQDLQEKLDDEDRGNFPLLEELPKDKTQLGQVPQDYFEQFESKIQAKIRQETTPSQSQPKGKTIKLRPAYVMGIAASVLLLILAGIWLIRGNISGPFKYQEMMAMDIDANLRQVSVAEANDYILAHLDEMETDELIENLTEKNKMQLEQLNGMVNSPMQEDTLPPKKEKEIDKQLTTTNDDTKKTQTDSPTSKSEGLQAEIEEDVIEETNLNELLDQVSDSDLDALEEALLGPKPKKTKEKTKK